MCSCQTNRPVFAFAMEDLPRCARAADTAPAPGEWQRSRPPGVRARDRALARRLLLVRFGGPTMPQTHQPKPAPKKPAQEKAAKPQHGAAQHSKETPRPSAGANEGEGNKTAARRYNSATEEYARSGRADAAANAAKKAMEGPERQELERAETEGRSRATDIERESDEEGL